MTEWNSESVTDWKICRFSQKPQQWLRPQVAAQRNSHEWGSRSASAFIVLYTSSGVCVSFFWKYAASPSCLFPPDKKSICKWNCSTRCLWKWRAVFAVSEPAQSQDFWNPEKATYSQLHLIFSSFVSRKQSQSLDFFMVRIYKILHLPGDDGFLGTYQMSDYHFFQWINSILETFTAP